MAALIFINQRGGIQLLTKSADEVESDVEPVTRKEKVQMFWRSFGVQSAFSFDRMQALGFTWILMPYLQKVYGDSDEYGAALKRHLTFFNTHPWLVGPIVALTANFEAKRAQNMESVDEASIQAVKGSLMGPLAGIGDSMIQGTLVPVMGGLAASLALEGIPVGPILFFTVVNVVHVYLRWSTLMVTFKYGTQFLENLDQESFQRFLSGASIAGLMGIGALVGTWLNIKTPVSYTVGESTVQLQNMFDRIMPKLLPLAATLLVYFGIKKGLKNTQIVLIIFVIGIVFGALRILG
jgi:mannose/fructose/sorbose-specific phosphotransferase system IID component